MPIFFSRSNFIPFSSSCFKLAGLFGVFFFYSILLNAQSDDFHQAMSKGESAASAQQFAQAIQHFNQAIKLNPQSKEAYLRQMECAIQKRDLAIFKRNIQQLEGLEHSLILDVYLAYAQLAKKQRLYNDGLKMLDKAELKYKNEKSIYLYRAVLYQKLNNNAAVIKVLSSAQKIDPTDLETTLKLASAYMPVNRQKSIDLFKQLQTKNDYKDIALSSLGLLYSKKYEADPNQNRNDLVLALGYYNQYAQRHPKDQETKNIIDNIRILLD